MKIPFKRNFTATPAKSKAQIYLTSPDSLELTTQTYSFENELLKKQKTKNKLQ